MRKRKMVATMVVMVLGVGCATVNLERQLEADGVGEIDNLDAELTAHENEANRLYVEEELKVVDIEPTVIYVDRPVYSPVEEAVEEPKGVPLQGAAAVKAAEDAALRVPLKFNNGVMYYPYDESFVYEIHCAPYRVTDVILEPGEEVLEMPFLSENAVWEVGAGVSRENGLDVQHFLLKPTVVALTTSMIVITNRRTYHMLLKSYKERYMNMVKWEYPVPKMAFHLKTAAMAQRMQELNGVVSGVVDQVDPMLLSFDYKMTYSIFRKPVWLPRRVYDDGRKTYIELDELVLHSEAPALFNNKNERINYRVQKNLVIIDELVEKVTLRCGKDRVVIEKKRYLGGR